MQRRVPLLVILIAVMMSVPSMPLSASGGRASELLTIFSDGRSSADVQLEPRPSLNRSLSISLPWNAEVTSASMTLSPADRSMTRSSNQNALELSQLPLENLTLSGNNLQLARGNWSWSQSGSGLGADCAVAGGLLGDGFRIGHSNPALSGSGGGVWLYRVPVAVTEQGGTARTNETVNLRMAFPAGTCTDPRREVRLTDSSGAEQPVFVQDATYLGNQCTGADLIFVLPSLGASAGDTYYVYHGNPGALRPSYARQVLLAETFTGPALPLRWSVSNQDGLSYSVAGSLQVQGTAGSEFWKGVSFETPISFPESFDVRFSLRPGTSTGSGALALLSIVQDPQNSVNFGLQYDSNSGALSPAKFTLGRTVSDVSTINYTADAGSSGSWHALRLACSAGTFSGYIDGALLGSVDVPLFYKGLRLFVAARATGDTVDFGFDGLSVSTGYAAVSENDPAPSLQAGAPAQVGYIARATLTSPLLENARLLPMGTARLEADIEAGTGCTLSIIGPDNETLESGLGNGQGIPPALGKPRFFRLQAVLTTTDPGRTPRLLSWGAGDLWAAGTNSTAEYPSLQNLTLSAGGISLDSAPDRWNRSASAVLNPGVTSTFDDAGVSHPWVLHVDGGYRMYYTGYDGSRLRIGLATSADGASWTRHPDNPVMVPGGGWETSGIDWPCVVYNGHGYEMWYAGSADGGASLRIGYASSGDGIVWTKHAQNPVLGPGAPGGWSSAGVFSPRVYLDGSGYTMWFAGKGPTVTSIGRAASADGIAWTQSPSNPMLGPAAAAWSSQGVVPGGVQSLPDGSFRLWYAGFNATLMGVGLAESDDGLAWTARPSPVLSNGTGTAFDKSGASYPSVLFEENGMWYTAYDGARYRIGLARPARFAEGSLLSVPVDLKTAPAFLRMGASLSTPAQTNLSVQSRTSADGAVWSGWTALGASLAPVPSGRYLQWAASLKTAANFSTPVVLAVTADFEYYPGSGFLALPAVNLQPSQELRTATATPSFSGAGVEVLCSIDNGTAWDALAPGVPFNLSGTALLMRVVLSGNHTATPRLAQVAYAYTYASYPSDCSLDAGADGNAEWSSPGVLAGPASVGGLAGALNTYLDAHRNDTGDTRLIPLSLSSATSSAVRAGALNVAWSQKTFTNNPPRIDSRPVERARINELYIYVVDGRDGDRRDRLSYALETAPGGMTISGTGGEITWQPSAEDVGYHAVKVTVSDGKAGASQEYTLVVSASPVNNPPHLAGSPSESATVGYEYTCAFTATDPDGDRVRFSLSRGSPAGASVNEDSGLLSWIPTAAQAGRRDLELFTSDGTDTVQFGFSINVSAAGANNLPVVTSNATPTARANQPFTYALAASDADGDALTFSFVSGPANATLSPQGAFAWTPVPSEAGAHNVIVRVSDGKGYTLYNFTIRVTASNRAPLFIGGPDSLKVPAGRAWNFLALASDADGDKLSYSLYERPAGMTIDPSSGSLSWSPPSSLSGDYRVSVAVSDGVDTTFLNFTLHVEGKAAKTDLLDQYGLIFVGIMIVVVAGGGAAAVLSGRRRTPAGGAPGTNDGAAGTEPEPGAGLSKPRIIAPSEPEPGAGHPGESTAPALPPPEPAAAYVSEAMKPVGTISSELQAAVAATMPPPSAMSAPPPLPPPLEPSAALPPPGEAPPAPVYDAQPAPPPQPVSRPKIAPPPAPTLAQPAPAPASRPVQAPAARPASPELYKPIPGPYDDRPFSIEGESPPSGPKAAPAHAASPAPAPYPATSAPSIESLMAEMEGGTKTTTPAPVARAEPAGLSDDMDFIASFLQSRDRPREERVVEKSAEWGMLKDFTKELGAQRQAPKPAPEPVARAQPAPPKKPEAPAKPEGSLSLDDILNELES